MDGVMQCHCPHQLNKKTCYHGNDCQQLGVYQMLLWFLVHAGMVSTHTTHGIVQVTDNIVQCTVFVLLTKLHHKSFCYLWLSFISLATQKVGRSTKSSCMNSTWTHPAGRESVPPPCLCAFRKSELGRGETTEWVDASSNHANAVSVQQ